MVVPHRDVDLPSNTHTPQSSPERSANRGGVLLAQRRQSVNAHDLDSSPEKIPGGVRLSQSPSPSPSESVSSNPAYSRAPEPGSNYDPVKHTSRRPSVSSLQSFNNTYSGLIAGLEHSPPISYAHSPAHLPHHFFPDASRSISSQRCSPEENTPDTATIDEHPPQQAPDASSDSQHPEQENEYLPPEQEHAYITPEPPAYEVRDLHPDKPRHPLKRLHNRMQGPVRKALKAILPYIRAVWLDVIFLLALTVLTGGLWMWAPLWHQNERLFPMTYDARTGTWLGPVEYSYPKHEFYLGITTTAILIPLIPLAVIVLMQFWVRSWLDFHAAFLGLQKALVMMLFIQVILKSYIGEFRPFFISACNPDPHKLANDFKPANWSLVSPPPRVFANTTCCRGSRKAVYFAMSSFPSGHTSEAFMAGTFLSLYLNAKLKALSDYETETWKLLVVMAPVIGSMFIAGSLVADRNHHHHDIILSIPIGVLVALLAYRTHYASVFDYRTNHIPLPWSSSNESLNSTAQDPDPDTQRSRSDRLFKPRNNYFTATAWPRKPKTYPHSRADQEEGTTSVAQPVDGAQENLPPLVLAGGHTLRRRYGVVKRGRTRVALFPRAERSGTSETIRRRGDRGSSARISPITVIERRPDRKVGGMMPGRIGVDDWVDTNPYDGEMV